MSAVDPWLEIAGTIQDELEKIEDIGVVVAGHIYVQEWADFLETYTSTIDGASVIRGWQIVEPQVGDGYQTELQTLGSTMQLEDTLSFFIRGFTEMGDDKDASQADFRNLAWEAKRKLDALVRFTLSDTGLSVPRSYPAAGLRVVPMVFHNVECWGCDMTKRVRIQRTETATGSV